MSLSSDLFRLQTIDTLRDQAVSRIREIDKILQNDQMLIQAQEQAKAAEQNLQDAYHALTQAENAVRSHNIKIEQNQASLYGGKVRNPKELQDLQNEAAALKRHLTILEDHQLETMMNVEESELLRNQAHLFLHEAEARSIEKQSGLIGERNRLLQDVSKMESEREMLARSMPAENIATYERLRQQKRGIAVARATDQTCSICGSTLTPAEWQLARSPHKLFLCPTCGRILYAG